MNNRNSLRVFGVEQYEDRVYLFAQSASARSVKFETFVSENGENFKLDSSGNEIKTHDGKSEKVFQTSNWYISRLGPLFLLTYQIKEGEERRLATAYSSDRIHYQKIDTKPDILHSGKIVPNYQYNDKTILFFGESELRIAQSRDLQNWKIHPSPVLTLNTEQTRGGQLKIADIQVTKNHILVYYFFHKGTGDSVVNSLRVVLFDKNNPYEHHVDHHVLYHQVGGWTMSAVPLGLVRYKGTLISYWLDHEKEIITLKHDGHLKYLEVPEEKNNLPLLGRLAENPIIKPIFNHWWESLAVFNPAVIKSDDKIHLVYRAVGETSESMLGYASSIDGIHFDERLPLPIFAHMDNPEGDRGDYFPSCSLKYLSGGAGSYAGWAGGCGGCEDPRITEIDGRIYLIYVAYTGWSEPRLAMTSISKEDFATHRWRWSKPIHISRPGEVNKGGSLLPEKINGKYVIFHRIFPDILIDFVDSLTQFDGKTTWLRGDHRITRREDSWDSRKISVGATPLKTSEGWLVIYNAVDDLHDRIYQIGAMLLDLLDPTKVLFRSRAPILSAKTHYENQGLKYGVVYACGAIEHNKELLVYYGGSDQYVCIAHSPIDEFLAKLKNTGRPQLELAYQPINISR